MAKLIFRRLVAWPGEKRLRYQRTRSAFDSTWGQTLELLRKELDRLHVKEANIQVDCDDRDIDRDGIVRAKSRLESPGVILTYVRVHVGQQVPYAFPCDRFDDWQDNVRAIALALAALRKVDRYGVTQRGEQYRGFQQLPAPTSNVAMDATAAAVLIGGLSGAISGSILAQVEIARGALRQAQATAHPDKPGGSTSVFQRVQEAKAVLSKHHGVAL